MEDREFFDHLLQLWAKTTGAKDHYWMPQEDESFPGCYDVIAVGENDERKPLAAFMNEIDSDFVTAVHGCFPDLFRRMNDALDEAERLDEARDDAEGRYAAEVLRNEELKAELADLRMQRLEPPF